MNEDNDFIDLSGITFSSDSVITDDVDNITINVQDLDLGIYGSNYTTNTTSPYSLDSFNLNYNPGVDITAGDLTVHEQGDIKLGERSLKEFMNKMEERLNILHPNPELENHWNELKQLGEQYRKLEEELLEKERMWKALNQE